MDVQRTRSLHCELANLFFPQDEDESTLENESNPSESKSVISLKGVTLFFLCFFVELFLGLSIVYWQRHKVSSCWLIAAR